MNQGTKEAADKLKDLIQGKSKTEKIETFIGKRKRQAREFFKNLKELKKPKTEKMQMKDNSYNNVQTEHESIASGSQLQEHTGSLFTKRTVVLPPPPRAQPVARPRQPILEHTMNLPTVIQQLLNSSSRLNKPLFRFDVSDEAARFNMNLLKKNNFNLEKLLNATPSITSYGSEFKSANELEPLLKLHPRWKELKKKLRHGACFPVKEVEDNIRLQDMEAMKIRGNHKSATKHEKYLADAFIKEVEKGWILLLPDEEAKNIPGLELAPMGVADQIGISATGEFVSKLRVTHDLSFPQEISGTSLNSRVVDTELEPCMFGHTLLRLVHHIIKLRNEYPKKKIWLRKEDFKSAYRRMHLNATTALQASVRVKLLGKYYVLVSLRLPFGGSPCPSDFCLISDIITDTINDLLACKDWDPNTVQSEYVTNIPPPKPLPEDIPYAMARSLSVSLENEPSAKADVFVDDIMSIAVDHNDNLTRLATAPCTVIHAIAHKACGQTYLKRQDLISAEKNEAEGAPEEVKICLGWLFNTRKLLISLPTHKFEAWDAQICSIIKAKSVSFKLLETVLGRLENVAIILTMFRHFLNNIRSLQIKASKSKHNQKLSKNALAEFELGRTFLKKAHNGISMNNIVFREPNRIYIGDASEHGLGGMCTRNGKAWRFLIPEKLRGRAHINLLEFLIQVVSIWVDIDDNNINAHDCLLAMGDNTTAAGWCRRTNFRESTEGDQDWIVKQNVARKLATLILEADCVLYTQWFKGSWNLVTDSLSRDVHLLSPNLHTQFLHKTVPKQLPSNFHIAPLPKKISSFITLTLQQLPVRQLRLKQQKVSDLARSKLGSRFSPELASQDPFIWTDLILSKRISSFLPSLTPFEPAPSLQEITETWWKEQSSPPSHMWRRPSGQTTGQTQDWTLTARHASCSTNSREHIRIKTVPERNKKLSL